MTPENELEYWRRAEAAALEAERLARQGEAPAESWPTELLAEAKDLRDKADAFFAAILRNSREGQRSASRPDRQRQIIPMREAFQEWDEAVASGLPFR